MPNLAGIGHTSYRGYRSKFRNSVKSPIMLQSSSQKRVHEMVSPAEAPYHHKKTSQYGSTPIFFVNAACLCNVSHVISSGFGWNSPSMLAVAESRWTYSKARILARKRNRDGATAQEKRDRSDTKSPCRPRTCYREEMNSISSEIIKIFQISEHFLLSSEESRMNTFPILLPIFDRQDS